MTAPETAEVVIDSPGVYDIPADVYHADPVPGGSLSSSGARKLLPPSCPALFQHDREHGQKPRPVFELGHAAHKVQLGSGPELVLVERDIWNTKEVKAEVAAIRAAGKIPLKRVDYERVHDMAAALQAHPIASALLRPGAGQAEQSLFWVDPETRIKCRARLDWLPYPVSGRLIVPDYKTCVSAAPDELQRAIYQHGYHMQADWYLSAVRALGLAGDEAQFLLIAQEKEPPYLVTVAQPDHTALRIAAHENREARHLYRSCVASGRWPGYTDDVALISLPGWVENRYAAQELM